MTKFDLYGHQIIEDLVCPFGERRDRIILLDGKVVFHQRRSNYHVEMKLDIQELINYTKEIEKATYRSQSRKKTLLEYLKSSLNKMTSHNRSLRIDKLFEKEDYEI